MPRVAFVLRAGAGGWLGGINYLRNLLTAVAAADLDLEPVLFVADTMSAESLAEFPGIEVVRSGSLRAPRRGSLGRILTAEQARLDTRLDAELRAAGIELLSHTVLMGRPRVPAMGWIPDFQHRRLPGQFAALERRQRDMDFRRIVGRSIRVIVSSQDAASDLAAFSAAAADRTAILRFAVAPVSAGTDRAAVDALGLSRYIHLPNQLWRHKNHALVIEALGLLAQEGSDILVVSTGDGHDHRAPGHREALVHRAAELGVEDRFRLLGRVSYDEMVALMRNAVAVLNPSLFEGWSTTVEEARALGKRVVLSDLPVHREQDPAGALFFDPSSPEALAAALQQAWEAGADPVPPAQAEREAIQRHRDFGGRYGDLVATALS